MTLLPEYVYINTHIHQQAHWTQSADCSRWITRHKKGTVEKQAHLEWNHSAGISKHPSARFLSQLSSRRSNFQESNIHTPSGFNTREITRCHTFSVNFFSLTMISVTCTWFYIRWYIYIYIMFLFSPKRCGFRLNAHEAFRRSSCDAFVGVGDTNTYPVTNGDQRRLDTHWATFLRPSLASTIRACVLPLRHFPRSSVVWTTSNIWGIFEQLLRRENVYELFFFFYGVNKFFNV